MRGTMELSVVKRRGRREAIPSREVPQDQDPVADPLTYDHAD